MINWSTLLDAANQARANAHAPYSNYQVGAAILTASGNVYNGCNVENASYGLTICAERTAIVKMVSAGDNCPIALVVVTRGPHIGSPCGMCRQTLAEFAEDLPIALYVDNNNNPVHTKLSELLPMAFRAEALTAKS